MSFRTSALLLAGSVAVYLVTAALATNVPGNTTRRENSSRPGFSSDALAAADTQQSGSRLKATYIDGDDGSRQFLAWYDPSREVDCSFAVAVDRSWRCLPRGADAGLFFADASCDQRLATVPKGCKVPPYAIRHDLPACAWEPATQVFSLGERYTGPLAYWVVGGACAAVTSTDLVLVDLYMVGAEVPPSSFVHGTRKSSGEGLR